MVSGSFLFCELGAPLFTKSKGAGTYFTCIPAMNRRMYQTLVDITSAGVFLWATVGECFSWRLKNSLKTSAQTMKRTSCQKGGPILVTVNGEEKNAAGKTIYAYLLEEGYDTSRVVVEQNLTIIPQDQLENTMIKEGDQLEILCFVGGG